MITVDCRDVESVLHELAIYVSDQVAAVPAMKLHQFVLAPIMDEDPCLLYTSPSPRDRG